MNNVLFRPVEKKDIEQVFPLLQQLVEIDYSNRDKEKCWELFESNAATNSIVGVYEDEIVAYGSIIIENKIRGGISGHIEDIVVSNKIRNKNIGTNLIKHLVEIGEQKGCYRITLFCKKDLISFYSRNGFEVNNIVMKKFINR